MDFKEEKKMLSFFQVLDPNLLVKIKRIQKKELDFLVMQEEWMWVYLDVDKP